MFWTIAHLFRDVYNKIIEIHNEFGGAYDNIYKLCNKINDTREIINKSNGVLSKTNRVLIDFIPSIYAGVRDNIRGVSTIMDVIIVIFDKIMHIDNLERKVDKLMHIDNLERKVDKLMYRIDNLERKVDKLMYRIDNLERKVDKLSDLPNYNIDEEEITEITEKIDKLQKDVDDMIYIMKYQIVPALNYLIKKI